jgi:hypothetical protein
MSLVSNCEFSLVNVDGVSILSVLYPGQRFFKMYILDFVSSTLVSTSKFYSFGKYPLYFIGINKCENEKEKCVQGIMGGETGRYQEFRISVDVDKKTLGPVEKLFEFNKLVTEKYRIDRVEAFGEYYLMIGDFGQMEVSKMSVWENAEIPAIKPSPEKPKIKS